MAFLDQTLFSACLVLQARQKFSDESHSLLDEVVTVSCDSWPRDPWW